MENLFFFDDFTSNPDSYIKIHDFGDIKKGRNDHDIGNSHQMLIEKKQNMEIESNANQELLNHFDQMLIEDNLNFEFRNKLNSNKELYYNKNNIVGENMNLYDNINEFEEEKLPELNQYQNEIDKYNILEEKKYLRQNEKDVDKYFNNQNYIKNEDNVIHQNRAPKYYVHSIPSHIILTILAQSKIDEYKLGVKTYPLRAENFENSDKAKFFIGRNAPEIDMYGLLTPKNDKACSNIYAKLNLRELYEPFRSSRLVIMELLKASSPKSRQKHYLSRLPNVLIYEIFQYIKEPRYIEIQDISHPAETLKAEPNSSISGGIFIKMKPKEKVKLQENNKILIGFNICANVGKILSPSKEENLSQNLLFYAFKHFITQGTRICGLPENLNYELDIMRNDSDRWINTREYQQINLDEEYKFPYSCLNIIFNNPNSRPDKYLLFNHQKEFIIGRSNDSDIILSDDSSISRKHSRLYYNHENDEWYIEDGINGKNSLNGTWKLLILSDKNTENKSTFLFNGDQIKLGSCIFEFLFENNSAKIQSFWFQNEIKFFLF